MYLTNVLAVSARNNYTLSVSDDVTVGYGLFAQCQLLEGKHERTIKNTRLWVIKAGTSGVPLCFIFRWKWLKLCNKGTFCLPDTWLGTSHGLLRHSSPTFGNTSYLLDQKLIYNTCAANNVSGWANHELAFPFYTHWSPPLNRHRWKVVDRSIYHVTILPYTSKFYILQLLSLLTHRLTGVRTSIFTLPCSLISSLQS